MLSETEQARREGKTIHLQGTIAKVEGYEQNSAWFLYATDRSQPWSFLFALNTATQSSLLPCWSSRSRPTQLESKEDFSEWKNSCGVQSECTDNHGECAVCRYPVAAMSPFQQAKHPEWQISPRSADLPKRFQPDLIHFHILELNLQYRCIWRSFGCSHLFLCQSVHVKAGVSRPSVPGIGHPFLSDRNSRWGPWWKPWNPHGLGFDTPALKHIM